MTAALALAIVVDVSVALAAGLLIACAFRRQPAALRHSVLAAALAVAASAPLLEVTLPRLELPVLSNGTTVATTGPVLSGAAPTVAPLDTHVEQSPRIGVVSMLVAAWATGSVVLLVSLLAGFARLTWMTRHCRPVRSHLWRERAAALSAHYGIRRSVVVLESPDRALLLTWGLMRPRIVVPASAASWNTDRIDVVLGHELAHIARCDWAVQVAADTLRAVHWFNPLMWVACRQLRVESEHACDDAVLRRGVDAADYASHLLAVARHVVTAGGGWASAPAIAHVSTLERRIAAMLNVSSNRQPVTRAARLMALAVTLAMTVPIAAATLTERIDATPFVSGAVRDITLAAAPAIPTQPIVEKPAAGPTVPRADAVAPVEAEPAAAPAPAVPLLQQKPATVSGTIRDTQGGVLPGVLVVLSNNAAAAARESTTTDGSGQFRFRNVAPGEYQFTASLPGFTTRTTALNLAEGQELVSNLTLTVGQIAEMIVVTCAPATAAIGGGAAPALSLSRRSTAGRLFPQLREVGVAPALAQQRLPVRVGGNIKAPNQVKKVAPRCPAVTPGAGLIVILEATIGADGLVKDVRVLRPNPADEKQNGYVQEALTAVRQWEYTPTLLNNVPTAIIMTTTVTFTVPPATK
jgi:beta-lactamase regulating signal transducer with metallopeptidase domain